MKNRLYEKTLIEIKFQKTLNPIVIVSSRIVSQY